MDEAAVEMDELRGLQEQSRHEFERQPNQSRLSPEEEKEAMCFGDRGCEEIALKEIEARRAKRSSEAEAQNELDQRLLKDIKENRERKAREAVDSERLRNEATATDMLNAASQIFMGVAAGQASSESPSAGQQPPPAYVPEPSYSSTGTRSQVVTPRNTGSATRGAASGCKDSAPVSGGGGPRC